jgi:short chain dehydrogenase
MLLEGKNAVIYGGGGSIGGAVARAFASEGANIFLAGRTLATLDEAAAQIRSAGGEVETARVDALDERAVDARGCRQRGRLRRLRPGQHQNRNRHQHDRWCGRRLATTFAEKGPVHE